MKGRWNTSCFFDKRIKITLFVSLFILTACHQTYPVDNEQLGEEERIVIRLSHVVGENTPKGRATRKFADLIAQRTDDYVEVQVFPNSFLYKDGEEFDALISGDVQMIVPSTSKLTQRVPEWQVIDLPFAFNRVEEVRAYIEGPVGKVLMEKLKKEGIYPLAFWENGFKQMTNNRAPLKVPDDFDDLSFRVMQSETLMEQFELLGANARVETFDQVFSVLDNADLNAQENTFSNIVSKNIHTVQNHVTVSNHGYLGYLVLMNDEFWNDLPDDIQIIFLETLEEMNEWVTTLAEEINTTEYKKLQKVEEISIHELTSEERELWEEAFRPLYQSFKEKYGASYIDYLPK